MFAALGKFTNLSGMYLKSKHTNSEMKVDKPADKQYTRIRTEQSFVPKFISQPKEKCFTLSLLNIQPLRKHLIGITNTPSLAMCVVVRSTET